MDGELNEADEIDLWISQEISLNFLLRLENFALKIDFLLSRVCVCMKNLDNWLIVALHTRIDIFIHFICLDLSDYVDWN